MKYLSYLKEKNKNKNLHLCCIPSLLASLKSSHPLETHQTPRSSFPHWPPVAQFSTRFIAEAPKQLVNAHRLYLTPIHSSSSLSFFLLFSLCHPKPLLTAPFTSYDVLLLLCQSATRDTINHSLFQEISSLGLAFLLCYLCRLLRLPQNVYSCFRIPSWAWYSLSALFFLGNLSNSQTL